jgi:hypothetical protein
MNMPHVNGDDIVDRIDIVPLVDIGEYHYHYHSHLQEYEDTMMMRHDDLQPLEYAMSMLRPMEMGYMIMNEESMMMMLMKDEVMENQFQYANDDLNYNMDLMMALVILLILLLEVMLLLQRGYEPTTRIEEEQDCRSTPNRFEELQERSKKER